MSWILPFHSWRLYQALLSWPTFARSWGHLRKCQFCFLMLQSWPGIERRGVNRVQSTIQMCHPPSRCAFPHIEIPNTSVCSAQSCCHVVLYPMLTPCHRALCFLKGAEPLSFAVLPDLLETEPGLCNLQEEEGQMALGAPSRHQPRAWHRPCSLGSLLWGCQGPTAHSFPWHSSTQLQALCRPAARSRHDPGGLPVDPGPIAAGETKMGCSAGALCSWNHNAFPYHWQSTSPPAFLPGKAPHQGSTHVRKGRGGDRLQIK